MKYDAPAPSDTMPRRSPEWERENAPGAQPDRVKKAQDAYLRRVADAWKKKP